MARGLRWLAVPLAAVLGYYVVGPRLAGNSKLNRLVQEGKQVVQSHTPLKMDPTPTDRPTATKPEGERPTDPKTSDAPAPKVTVGVKPVDVGASNDDPPKPRTRRRRHRNVQPMDEAPPETTATPDRTGPDPASTP